MSILVKNVNWSQSQSEVFVNVAIGGKKSTENVIIADKFLKINVHPYFYEVFFENPIDAEQSSCKILESNFKFKLKKRGSELWSSLGKTVKPNATAEESDILSSAEKREILSEYEHTEIEKDALRLKELAQFKRNEIDKQIDRESERRRKIDETEAALNKLDISEVNDKHIEVPKQCHSDNIVKSEVIIKPRQSCEGETLPPIRRTSTISVNLTSREFVTPKRESQDVAEREWWARQHEIMVNRVGFSDDDLSTDERDVFWLLQKGHDFLQKKNFLAAVSAFSFAMRFTQELPELFLGRARAQFALQNYKRCAEDSSDALERFKPAVQSNLLSRIHCYWLRGKALISLGLIKHGEREIEMASQLDPMNFTQNQERFLIDTK